MYGSDKKIADDEASVVHVRLIVKMRTDLPSFGSLGLVYKLIYADPM